MRALVIEELLEKVQNRFLLTVSAARRARQLKDGAKRLIDAPEDESAVIIALDEILEDKIDIQVGEITGSKPLEIDMKKVSVKATSKKEKEPKGTPVKKKTTKAKKEKKHKKSRSMAA
ncbi:DNA-directed RNA polymerase subunit omega [Candidatus Margulisiibacteriota bacterium]